MLNSKFFLVQIKLFTREYPGAQYQKVDEQVFLRSRSNWNSWKHFFGMGWGWGVGLGVVGVLRKGVREEPGCLPFTGANRLVHGLGKGDAKFRTGKCRPGIAYTICTNQLHSPKNDREDLKLVSTMAFNKWNTNFCLEYSVRKKQDYLSDVPFFPEIFHWNDQKSHVPFTFQPDFLRSFCKW